MDWSTFALLGGLSVFVGALIGGIGIGGVFLVPILTYIFDVEVHMAIAAAMFSYLFSGLIGTSIYARKRSINWNMALWLFAGAMPAAFMGARWWTLDDLLASTQPVLPALLREHLAPIVAGDLPEVPIDISPVPLD